MPTNQILIEAFGRVREVVHRVLERQTTEALAYRPTKDANSAAWQVWHLARIQDDHIADAVGVKQVWTAAGWAQKFDLPFETSATGYGQNSKDVAAVRASAQQLLGYYDAVHAQTISFIKSLQPTDYERVVDERWDPPVTLAVRLVSVLSDDLQHAGQAAYVLSLYRNK